MTLISGCGPATDTRFETVASQLSTPLTNDSQTKPVEVTETSDINSATTNATAIVTPTVEKTIVLQEDTVNVENAITEVNTNSSTKSLKQNEETEEVSDNTNQKQLNTSIDPANTATSEPVSPSTITEELPETTHNTESSIPVAPTEPVVIQPTPPSPSKLAWPEAPDFSLPSAQGTQVELSSYKGDKNTILVFYRAYW